jgi:uncharacterized membrane protein
MPFMGRDWRSPGEAWVKTGTLGWQRMKIMESQLYLTAGGHPGGHPACSWPPRSQFGQHMAANCNESASGDGAHRTDCDQTDDGGESAATRAGSPSLSELKRTNQTSRQHEEPTRTQTTTTAAIATATTPTARVAKPMTAPNNKDAAGCCYCHGPSAGQPNDATSNGCQQQATEAPPYSGGAHPKTAPHCRISVRTKEVAMHNTISEAFHRLDFYNAIHDIRRFNYICKLLHLLITQNLTSLSGCATRVLFTMLEQVAWEGRCTRTGGRPAGHDNDELRFCFQSLLCFSLSSLPAPPIDIHATTGVGGTRSRACVFRVPARSPEQRSLAPDH